MRQKAKNKYKLTEAKFLLQAKRNLLYESEEHFEPKNYAPDLKENFNLLNGAPTAAAAERPLPERDLTMEFELAASSENRGEPGAGKGTDT